MSCEFLCALDQRSGKLIAVRGGDEARPRPRTVPLGMSMKTFAALLLPLAILVMGDACLWAQRPARVVDSYDSLWSADCEWSLSEVGELLFADAASRASAAATSAIRIPGGMYALSSHKCLMCGSDSAGNGVVELWEFVAQGSLVLSSVRVDPGMDYSGVAYDQAAQVLYLLDASGTLLSKGTWDGSSALASVTLVPLASAVTVPELAAADDATLLLLGPGVLGLAKYPMRGSPAGSKITVTALAVTVEPWAMPPGQGHGAYVVPVDTSDGSVEVRVKAVMGAAFDIVRLSDGAVVGSGVGQGPAAPVAVVTTAPLVLGERYAARVQGQAVPTNLAFECVRRYGESDSLSDGATMRPFFYQRGANVGSVFNVQLLIGAPPRPADVRYDGFLMVAFRAPSDPVVLVGENYLLNPAFYLPVEGWIAANCRQGAVSVDVPIPMGLEGLVFLVQYWIADGAAYKFSQIYGSAIKPM